MGTNLAAESFVYCGRESVQGELSFDLGLGVDALESAGNDVGSCAGALV